MMTDREIKFGRFAMRSKPRKRIERATKDYDPHGTFTGAFLVVRGRIAKRGAVLTPADLEAARIRLVWGLLDNSSAPPSTSRFRVEVPFKATSAEIEAGWDRVADLVCARTWKASKT